MITARAHGKGLFRALLNPPGRRESLVAALNQTAADAAEIFREETPKASGATAAAWTFRPGSKRNMVATVLNAHRERGYLIMAGIEFGTAAHTIRPRPGKKALVFGADRSSIAEGRVHRGEAQQLNPVKAQRNMGGGSIRRSYMPRNQGIKSPIRYGNAIRYPGGPLRPIVASDVRTGGSMFRNSRGGLFGSGGERVVVVSMVRHPGTRPNPVIRRNLGFIRELFRQRVAEAAKLR